MAAVSAPGHRRGWRWFAAGVVLLAGAGSAMLFGRAAGGEAPPPSVAVARRTLRSQVQATGTVRATTGAEVKVGARISGRVERLYANVGDKVRRGAVIAHLDDRDLRARLARARADLDAAQAQLALVRRGARPEELDEAQAVLSQAEAEADLARVQEKRSGSLVGQKFAGAEELDRARRDAAVAQARVAAARSRMALLRRKYLPEEVALAGAKVRQAAAGVQQAAATLSYATIAAPVDGVVAQVNTQEGETVSAGLNAPTFVTIIDLDRLEVAAYVDEVDVGRVKAGQKAEFTVDSFPEVEFAGRVTAVYPRAVVQSNVVNYITTISVDNSEGRLKPDMTANATIALEERENVLAVPDKALRREGGRTVVEVLEPGGAHLRPVRVGMRGGGWTEVVSGLHEGDRLPAATSATGDRP